LIGTVRLWATGYTEFTVGEVVSAVVPVVKLHGFGAVALPDSGLPAESVAAVSIVAVYVVEAASAGVGRKIAVLFVRS
jgi:hypothetical protein